MMRMGRERFRGSGIGLDKKTANLRWMHAIGCYSNRIAKRVYNNRFYLIGL